tara:strand:+ start:185 stop:655 length:471 start_codon:yes stop_codon:yes gene_type:complete
MSRSNKKLRNYRVDWVLCDEIALGSAPKRIEHLNHLNDLNIKSILSLCSEEEAPPPIEMKDKFICSRLVLPDHKQGRLPKSSEIKEALNLLKYLKENSGPTFVHCVASMERSPLICIAWLVVENNFSLQIALDYVMQIHPGTSPLPGQLDAIKALL